MVKLKVEKSADRNYIFLNMSNRIKYSVIITNLGNSKATCVKIKDCMGIGEKYISGTFSINGKKQNVKSLDKFISIGAIKPNSNILVSYDVEVIEYNTPTMVESISVVSYCYEGSSDEIAYSQKLQIPAIKIDVCVNKEVDKKVAKVGNVLSYSVLVRNNSNIPINNIVFFDDLNESLELLPASVFINLIPQYIENFNGGMSIGTLNAYSSLVISFQAKIINRKSIPNINNISKFEFTYSVCDSGILITSVGEICSNEVITKIMNEPSEC